VLSSCRSCQKLKSFVANADCFGAFSAVLGRKAAVDHPMVVRPSSKSFGETDGMR
jgi:hypothetical protein